MNTEKKILIAFLLNAAFSVFELVGGILTGSVAILSDALHDLGDAAVIGASYFLEKKGGRYSVLGSIITSTVLLLGSGLIIFRAVGRLLHPVPIHYDGMILFAVVGVCVNLGAAYFTREGDSLNQRAVNLHMLEDVLGWAAVLVGAVIMRWTGFVRIDPLLSMGMATFILVHAIRNLRESIDLFLGKTPLGIDPEAEGGHHHHHHHHH